MKTKLLLGAALAALCLAGCAGQVELTSPNTSAIDAAVGKANTAAVTAFPSLAKIEASLKGAFAKACGASWIPAAETVAGLAATLSGSVLATSLTSAATGLAKQGCALATAPANNGVGLLDRPAVPTLRGVPLLGTRVR